MTEQFASVFQQTGTAQLIVGTDLRVTHANRAALDLLKKHEREVRKVYAQFEHDRVVGLALRDVPPIPAVIMAWFRDAARQTRSTYVEIGADTFHVLLYPLRGTDGTDLGTGVEFWCATDQLAAKTNNQKIVDIVGVIDDLTMQSNMLSLNAAVEAARLGQHGSGFTVIAAEMRLLAQKSRDAARQIKDSLTRA